MSLHFGRSLEAIRVTVSAVGRGSLSTASTAGLSAACHVVLSGLGFVEEAAERQSLAKMASRNSARKGER